MKKLQITLIGIFLLLGCAKEEALTPAIIDMPPSVFTEDATNVTLKSAFILGKVEDVPYAPTIERGFIYANNPDIGGYGITIKLDTNITTFKSHLTKLTPNKTYYYNAYAKNKYGTAYGELKNFTTGDYILPTLTTDSLGNITLTSVKLYGNITDDGETPILKRGFCISTNPTPTTTDSTFNAGEGMGAFNLVVIKLKAGTKYNVRAFATNAMGTSYGKEITFSTLDYKLPTIQTNPVTDIGLNVATLSGNVKDLGRGELKERGIVLSKSQKPTIDDMKFKSSVTDLGEYKIVVTKLEVNTKYYARAYTQNEAGIVYGDEVNFSTLDYTFAKISTNDIGNISFRSARIGGEVTNEGNTPVTERGVVISREKAPTISDRKLIVGNGLGGYMVDVNELIPNSTYYIRAYCINSKGIVYGNERNFRTLDDTPPPAPIVSIPTIPSPPPTTFVPEPVVTTPPPTTFVPGPVVTTPPPLVSNLPEYISVPDSRFEQALIDRGYDFVLDGRIKTAPIANATTIEILNPMGIVSIRGIEAFPNLQRLRIIHNQISSVDLSKNLNLTWVSFWDNKLTSIDVSSLSKLEYFGAGDNDIVTFDVSRNKNLIELDFGNTEGRAGYGTTRGVTSIDITHNPNLQQLYMQNNRLTSLNLSGNPMIKGLWVHDNKIESLDCTRNPLLSWFLVWNNNLRYLNIKGLPSIFIDRLYTYNNPNLSEIRVQSVQKLLQKKSDCGGCFNVDSWTKYVE
jgi:Leucine-rich repeat (LRR) protein